MEEDKALVLLDQADQFIEQATTIGQAKDVADTFRAIEIWAKRAKKSPNVVAKAIKYQGRAEARMGALLKQMRQDKIRDLGGRKGNESQNGTRLPGLKDFGISKNQSSRAQLFASLSKSKLEESLDEAGEKASLPAAVRNAKVENASARRKEREDNQAAANKENHPLAGERFKLMLGDVAKPLPIVNSSVDAIITDPPYPEEFLHVYPALAVLALRVLKPGGNLLVMCGQSHLPRVYQYLTSQESLSYWWTLAYLTGGQSTQVFGRRVKSNWKPVLWLVKGNCISEHVYDIVKSDGDGGDKAHHEWGQNVSGMIQLVERFTVKGNVVLDPFVGGGATAIAAVKSERLFLGVDIEEQCLKQTAKRLAEL